MLEEDLKAYENELKNFKFPKLSELPNIELYMDQVIEYTKTYFKIIELGNEKELITPSMINNYVKNGIIPAPNGKKYSKRHLAYIIAVFYLKQILTLDEVKSLITNQIKNSDEKIAYLYFCEALESEFSNCCNHHYNEIINDANETLEIFSLKYSARAIANKIYAQHIIALQKKNG
ncbi:MAG: DUF1836 domain-containing protein [Clostridia bacterium]|nr:DUF1836 domain-containing protein [Clostridia bacterium]